MLFLSSISAHVSLCHRYETKQTEKYLLLPGRGWGDLLYHVIYMQIIQRGEHIDKISLHLIWYALHFINSSSFPYYELEIGMAWADELEAGEGRGGKGGVKKVRNGLKDDEWLQRKRRADSISARMRALQSEPPGSTWRTRSAAVLVARRDICTFHLFQYYLWEIASASRMTREFS